MIQAEALQVVPGGIHSDGLDASHGADIIGMNDGVPDGGTSAVTAIGVFQCSTVGVSHGSVVVYRSQRCFSGIQCRRIFSDDLDGGSRLTEAVGGTVHHQTCGFLSSATHQCFYFSGGRLHHDCRRLYTFSVPAVPIHFFLRDLLERRVLGGMDRQSAPVEIQPGILLRVP